jgi:hypothetical protein
LLRAEGGSDKAEKGAVVGVGEAEEAGAEGTGSSSAVRLASSMKKLMDRPAQSTEDRGKRTEDRGQREERGMRRRPCGRA